MVQLALLFGASAGMRTLESLAREADGVAEARALAHANHRPPVGCKRIEAVHIVGILRIVEPMMIPVVLQQHLPIRVPQQFRTPLSAKEANRALNLTPTTEWFWPPHEAVSRRNQLLECEERRKLTPRLCRCQHGK